MAQSNPQEVQMDRRDTLEVADGRRQAEDRRVEEKPVEVERRQQQRRKVQRRRQIDPTTCERDYTGEEIEFMQALDAYKRKSGRMFPTCSEILEVVRDLGYVRLQPGEQLVVDELWDPAADDLPEGELFEEDGDEDDGQDD